MVKIHFKRSTKTPVTSTSNSTAAAAAAATTIVATPDIKTNTNRDNENQQTTSATPTTTTTTSNQEQNEHSQHQHQHQQNQSNQATNFFLHTRNRGDLRATLYGLYGDSKKSSKAAAKQSNSATISSSGHKTSQHQSSSTSRIIKPTPSMNAAGTTARPSTRTIMKNSSDKTVISTPLPPYEIEVTEVDGKYYIECPLCVLIVNFDTTPDLQTCDHRTCLECMQNYLKTEINHSRLNITCPICSEPMLQNVIRDILKDEKFYAKYESFMLRKVLAAEPDARWCPAPDCGYAVLANGCASCPRLVCERKSCNTAFCYHCKQEWHPNQTCSSASIQRNKRNSVLDALNIGLAEDSNQTDATNDGNGEGQQTARKSSKSSQQTASLKPDDIKECPVCSSRIIKMNDGSCNHMTCSICETEFCWLCMKEINDLHYFSPSGCTFWGKKPWSRKKKLLWRLGMLVGAPICIIFIAGIAVPAIVIGIPVWAARKLHTRLERKQFSRYRKNAIITGGVLLSFVVSPIISAMALAIGVPILLGYVYGVVPLSLCRSSGGCLSSSPSIANIPQQYQPSQARGTNNLQATDVISIDTATSHKLGNPSIGETSMYMSNLSLETNSIGHVTSVGREDRESASNAALAGSIMGANTDDGSSTRALAGSIISKESGGYALIPAEIHNQQQRQASTVSH